MAVVRSVVRSAKLAFYFGRACLELLLRRPRDVREGAAWLHRFAVSVLRAFEVDLHAEGEFPARGALISNHTGYVDIIAYAALHPVVYCAKAEMEGWPVIGFMTRVAGSVFVERGAGGSAARAAAGMRAAAEAGIPVIFFPEGTTSNGRDVLPFRTGLLAQALAAGEPITAAHIGYTLDAGNEGATVEDNVCFWGEDAPMLKHIFRFVGLQGVHASVRIAETPIVFSGAEIDRKEAALEAREAVLRVAEAHSSSS